MTTPWGRSQAIEKVGEGIQFVSTASHGGYVLDAERNAKIPYAWRKASFNENGLRGFYEEDCDWTMVALTFPEYFSQFTGALEEATKLLKHFYPNLLTKPQ
jgi:hypothetical protein